MKKKISCILLVIIIVSLLSGCFRGQNKILNYLEEKYGSSKNFQFTKKVYGGGIGYNEHYREYTSNETNDKSFIVRYQEENGKIKFICDNYLVVKFSDDTKKVYENIMKQLKFNNFIIKPGIQGGNSCDYSVATEDYNEYLSDKNSKIYATIIIENNGENIDKKEISNTFIKSFKDLGILDKYEENYYLATIYFVNYMCDPVGDYSCTYTELFNITKMDI